MDRWVKNVFNENTSYSFKEALVHKICNISSLFPKTYNVVIENNGSNLSIEMEKLHVIFCLLLLQFQKLNILLDKIQLKFIGQIIQNLQLTQFL